MIGSTSGRYEVLFALALLIVPAPAVCAYEAQDQAPPQAEPQSRAELLRRQRQAKMRELVPQTADAIEQRMLALEDPAVDTLVVLTDGAPTGGRRYQLDLIVPLFLELNATRKVAVDSILVDAPVRLQRHWTALAEGTGGRSIAIEL